MPVYEVNIMRDCPTQYIEADDEDEAANIAEHRLKCGLVELDGGETKTCPIYGTYKNAVKDETVWKTRTYEVTIKMNDYTVAVAATSAQEAMDGALELLREDEPFDCEAVLVPEREHPLEQIPERKGDAE